MTESKTELELSVVVPVYNEQDNVEPLYQRVGEALHFLDPRFELIFVDDGSSDSTVDVARSIQLRDSRVRVIQLRSNFGQTAAMRAGIRYAEGRVIVTMDGDLQNDPADIPKLLQKLDEGYDLVVGWRRDRKDPFLSRTLPSRVANWLIGKITGIHVHDNGCSLKAYRGSLIKRVPLYSEMHRFIPALSATAGASIAEVVVRHHPRQYGQSKYGLSRIGKVLLDVVAVRTVMRCTDRPMDWFCGLSLPFLLLTIVSAVASAHSWTGGSTADFRWILPVTTILFAFVTLHMVFVGLLSELIIRARGGRDVGANGRIRHFRSRSS
jgi:hypothetical protein